MTILEINIITRGIMSHEAVTIGLAVLKSRGTNIKCRISSTKAVHNDMPQTAKRKSGN